MLWPKNYNMKEKPLSEILKVPNILSLSRIILTPIFLWIMSVQKLWWAFIIFCIAGMTDALDGFTARHFRLKTKLGIWLDPIGDKIFLTATFVALTIPGWSSPHTLPLWLTAICVGRDVLIALAALIIIGIRGRTIFPPSLLGKISTVFQFSLLFVVLLLNALDLAPSLRVFYVVSASLAFLSGLHYAFSATRMLLGLGASQVE